MAKISKSPSRLLWNAIAPWRPSPGEVLNRGVPAGAGPSGGLDSRQAPRRKIRPKTGILLRIPPPAGESGASVAGERSRGRRDEGPCAPADAKNCRAPKRRKLRAVPTTASTMKVELATERGAVVPNATAKCID